MRVDITIKQGCLWIESHAVNALNESQRHMAVTVSGKIRRGKRGFSAMANDICMCNRARTQILCSFAAPELLKSALVLVLLLLLVLVVVVVVVVVVAVVVVLVVVLVLVLVLLAAHRTSAFLRAPKNRQTGTVFALFVALSEQKTP